MMNFIAFFVLYLCNLPKKKKKSFLTEHLQFDMEQLKW